MKNNEELVKRYQETRDPAALDELCRLNKGLIGHIIKKLRWIYAEESAKTAAVTESADLMQEGFIELIHAAQDYRPEKGANFANFAATYIKNGILNRARTGNAVKVPAYRREQLLKLKKLRERIPDIDADEIAAYIGISRAQTAELLQLEAATVASLSTPIGDDLTLADTIPDDSDGIAAAVDAVYNDQLRAAIWAEVDALTPEQAAVIRGQYEEGETISTTAKRLHMDKERAYRLNRAALGTLAKSKALKHYAETCQIVMGRAYRGSVSNYLRTGTSPTERAALAIIDAKNRARRASRKERAERLQEIERQQRERIKELMQYWEASRP